jgi:hypothetical protein
MRSWRGGLNVEAWLRLDGSCWRSWLLLPETADVAASARFAWFRRALIVPVEGPLFFAVLLREFVAAILIGIAVFNVVLIGAVYSSASQGEPAAFYLVFFGAIIGVTSLILGVLCGRLARLMQRRENGLTLIAHVLAYGAAGGLLLLINTNYWPASIVVAFATATVVPSWAITSSRTPLGSLLRALAALALVGAATLTVVVLAHAGVLGTRGSASSPSDTSPTSAAAKASVELSLVASTCRNGRLSVRVESTPTPTGIITLSISRKNWARHSVKLRIAEHNSHSWHVTPQYTYIITAWYAGSPSYLEAYGGGTIYCP